MLQRLSVFAGGCALEVIEAVCAGTGLPPEQVLDTLVALVAKSMVIADRRPGGQTRYTLLETVRQYAREKLNDAAQDDLPRLRARHRDYFLTFAEPGWRLTVRWGMLAKAMEADVENVRLALAWSFGDPSGLTDLDAGPKLMMAFHEIWPSYQEQADWYRRALLWCQRHPQVSPNLRACVVGMAANTLSRQDPDGSLRAAQESVEISRELGPADPDIFCGIIWMYGMRALWELDDPDQAAALFAEAETVLPAVARQCPPDEYLAKVAWLELGHAELASRQGRYADAKRHASACLRHFQRTSLEYGVLQWGDQPALLAIAQACLSLRQYAEAREHLLEAQRLNELAMSVWRQNNKAGIPYWLAQVDLQQGDLERAQAYCRESLQEAERIPDYDLIARNLALAAGIAAQLGQPARAARLSGAAQTLAARQGTKLSEEFSPDTILPAWREDPSAPALSAAFPPARP